MKRNAEFFLREVAAKYEIDRDTAYADVLKFSDKIRPAGAITK